MAVGCAVCLRMYSRVKHQCRQRKSRTSFNACRYSAADTPSCSANSLTPETPEKSFTASRNARWFPGRYCRKSCKISVRGVSGIWICSRLSQRGIYFGLSEILLLFRFVSYHGVVGAGFAPERHRLLAHTLVNYAVGEHRL